MSGENWVLYVCPICGYAIRWPAISTDTPNRICYHGASVGYMDIVASGPVSTDVNPRLTDNNQSMQRK